MPQEACPDHRSHLFVRDAYDRQRQRHSSLKSGVAPFLFLYTTGPPAPSAIPAINCFTSSQMCSYCTRDIVPFQLLLIHFPDCRPKTVQEYANWSTFPAFSASIQIPSHAHPRRSPNAFEHYTTHIESALHLSTTTRTMQRIGKRLQSMQKKCERRDKSTGNPHPSRERSVRNNYHQTPKAFSKRKPSLCRLSTPIQIPSSTSKRL